MSVSSGSQPYITILTANDVLLGRGDLTKRHEGNVRFRQLIQEKREQYATARTKPIKDEVACEIVRMVEERTGRFVRKVESSSDEEKKLGVPADVEAWMPVDKVAALKKVKQAFRDNKPPTNIEDLSLISSNKRTGQPTLQVDPMVEDLLAPLPNQLLDLLHELQDNREPTDLQRLQVQHQKLQQSIAVQQQLQPATEETRNPLLADLEELIAAQAQRDVALGRVIQRLQLQQTIAVINQQRQQQVQQQQQAQRQQQLVAMLAGTHAGASNNDTPLFLRDMMPGNDLHSSNNYQTVAALQADCLRRTQLQESLALEGRRLGLTPLAAIRRSVGKVPFPFSSTYSTPQENVLRQGASEAQSLPPALRPNIYSYPGLSSVVNNLPSGAAPPGLQDFLGANDTAAWESLPMDSDMLLMAQRNAATHARKRSRSMSEDLHSPPRYKTDQNSSQSDKKRSKKTPTSYHEHF